MKTTRRINQAAGVGLAIAAAVAIPAPIAAEDCTAEYWECLVSPTKTIECDYQYARCVIDHLLNY